MVQNFLDAHAADGEAVRALDIPAALTAGTLRYTDGSTQTFSEDGSTTFVEHGRASQGSWSVEGDGRFASFWPPSYRATYHLRWIVEGGVVVGLTFVDASSGAQYQGRYE